MLWWSFAGAHGDVSLSVIQIADLIPHLQMKLQVWMLVLNFLQRCWQQVLSECIACRDDYFTRYVVITA